MEPAIWLYIALGIFVVGLIIVGIGVMMLLKGMKEPLKEMKESANNLKERADRLMLEMTSLQHAANELSEDMQDKTQKINQVIDAGKGTMNSVLDLNLTVRSMTNGITSRTLEDRDNIAQADQIGSMAIQFITYLKNRKS